MPTPPACSNWPRTRPSARRCPRTWACPTRRFELKLTPNRADCFSIRGIAFDVAAAMGAQVNALEIPEAPLASDAQIAVALDAGADCPRYCGRVIEGLDPNAKTPAWLAEKLRRAGMRPISPLVDVGHFVMLELGQPMHAFDADTLNGPVGVRRARAGERVKLLDEREVALDPGIPASSPTPTAWSRWPA